MTQPLGPGDPAPAFEVQATRNSPARLSDYAGKHLILFFYSEDDTELCTREVISFSDMQAQFTKAKAAVLGVSRDSLATHKAFVKKHDVKVRLGADEDGKMSGIYGTWGMKQLYGNKFMGMIRTTFLIGPDGLILRVWRNVRVPGHTDRIWRELTGSH